jgi:hydrophobic/amphiphilic exporter-1 (mainly G- bacteria), HAE1 family
VVQRTGLGGTQLKFDTGEIARTAELVEQIRKELPKSARANIGIGNQEGPAAATASRSSWWGILHLRLPRSRLRSFPCFRATSSSRTSAWDTGDSNTELSVRVDRARARAFGFNAQQVASFVGIAVRGTPLREFRRGDSEVAVWLRFADADEFGIGDLSSFMLRSPDGREVPLMGWSTCRWTRPQTRSSAPIARPP